MPALADELLNNLARRMGRTVQRMSREVVEALRAHPWPGNVRELENTLERALIFSKGDQLSLDVFPLKESASLAVTSSPATAVAPEKDDLSIKKETRRLEQRLIRAALRSTGDNRTRAARILEISPRALQYKIKEYEIEPLNRPSPPADTD